MLSDHLRPDIEAAPWVIDAVRKLEQELAYASLEMHKIRSENETRPPWMHGDKADNFLLELKALLAKYEATIRAEDHRQDHPECGQDVRMTVEFHDYRVENIDLGSRVGKLSQAQLHEGKIPPHTECPFKTECPVNIRGVCKHRGKEHAFSFSCATARAFDLVARSDTRMGV